MHRPSPSTRGSRNCGARREEAFRVDRRPEHYGRLHSPKPRTDIADRASRLVDPGPWRRGSRAETDSGVLIETESPASYSLSPPRSPLERANSHGADLAAQKNTPARHPEGVPYRGAVHLKLVVQLQRKLDLPRIVRIVARRSNFAEVRIGDVARTADRNYAVAAEVGSVEVRMVEDVKEFRSEFGRKALGNREFLEDREVQAMEAGANGLAGLGAEGCRAI